MAQHESETVTPNDDSRPQQTDCCPIEQSLADDAFDADLQMVAALGTATRYEALRIVAAAEDDCICGCDLRPALGVSQGAVSQALSTLSAAGLFERRTDGRWCYYSATPRARRVLDVLDETRPTA